MVQVMEVFYAEEVEVAVVLDVNSLDFCLIVPASLLIFLVGGFFLFPREGGWVFLIWGTKHKSFLRTTTYFTC